MLTYVVGDLFRSPAQVLVNTVNTVGVMGKGIAKTFKQVYPEMFEQYREHCETKQLTVGKLWLYKTPNKWILNFPTKTTWRKPSELSYIKSGLETFVRSYAERGITSIAFPALGCGNGELNWEHQVRPVMEKYLKPLRIDVFIYLYRKTVGTPEHRDIEATKEWLRQEPESLGFSEVWMDLKRIIGPGVELKSFYENRTINISIDEEDAGITVISDEETVSIYYDDLLQFWNILRTYGFGFPAIMPAGVVPYHDFLPALFKNLPYCNVVDASKDYDALGASRGKGIQYVPRPTHSNGLFNGKPKQFSEVQEA